MSPKPIHTNSTGTVLGYQPKHWFATSHVAVCIGRYQSDMMKALPCFVSAVSVLLKGSRVNRCVVVKNLWYFMYVWFIYDFFNSWLHLCKNPSNWKCPLFWISNGTTVFEEWTMHDNATSPFTHENFETKAYGSSSPSLPKRLLSLGSSPWPTLLE